MRFRPAYVALVAGAVMAGGGFWMNANKPNPGELVLSSFEPEHPITPELEALAASKDATKAEDFQLLDEAGNKHQLASYWKDKPAFVYFIKDGCPCSIEAEPMYHDLWKRHGKRVNFVGVIGSPSDVAAKWKTNHKMPYTILTSPDHKVMQAYKAPSSAFGALIVDGKILKMWPGWSQDILIEINKLMAESTDVDVPDFDPLYAPQKPATGCSFDVD